MPKFSGVGTTDTVQSGVPNGILSLTGGTTVKAKLYDVLMGTSGTPSDAAMLWTVIRSTTAGTGDAVTPALLDPDSVAVIVAGLDELTADPTISGAPLIQIGANARASYRWVAAPGGELISVSTAANGISLRGSSAAYALAADMTAHWEE